MNPEADNPVLCWDAKMWVSANADGSLVYALEGAVRFRRRLGFAEAGKYAAKMVCDRMPAAGLHSLSLGLDWDVLGRDVRFRAVGREVGGGDTAS